MNLDYFNGRTCVFGWEGDLTSFEVAKLTIETLSISENKKYFLGSGKTFFILKGDVVELGRYRDNWNGYHDVARYSLKTNEQVSQVIQANYSEGRHRAEFAN